MYLLSVLKMEVYNYRNYCDHLTFWTWTEHPFSLYKQ